MGFLDNDTIVVDAILTKHGRELLAKGQAINPTHFTLSDDGIDYTMWNTNSSSGSSGYDDFLTKLPMVEAVPDDAMAMKYTLFTLPQNTRFLPAVSLYNSPNAENHYTLDNDVTIVNNINCKYFQMDCLVLSLIFSFHSGLKSRFGKNVTFISSFSNISSF